MLYSIAIMFLKCVEKVRIYVDVVACLIYVVYFNAKSELCPVLRMQIKFHLKSGL